MTEMSELPRRERAKRYRAQAGEARARAVKSKGEMRTAFGRIAEHWEKLALEAEADSE
jgi:hypothetical protein